MRKIRGEDEVKENERGRNRYIENYRYNGIRKKENERDWERD